MLLLLLIGPSSLSPPSHLLLGPPTSSLPFSPAPQPELQWEAQTIAKRTGLPNRMLLPDWMLRFSYGKLSRPATFDSATSALTSTFEG